MSSGPILQVLFPVYNLLSPPSLLKPFFAALHSLLCQTHRDFLLTLIDDGSSDGTRLFLDGLLTIDERIEVFHCPANLGIAGALNFALQFSPCRSPFLARMDADDFSFPNRFERQLAYLRENPQLDIISGPIMIEEINEDNSTIKSFHNEDDGQDEENPGKSSSIEKQAILEGESLFQTLKQAIIGNSSITLSSPITPFPLRSLEIPISSPGRLFEPPVNPYLCDFLMNFSCVLVHPAVMMRRAWVEKFQEEKARRAQLNGNSQSSGSSTAFYSPHWQHCEDYQLWLHSIRFGAKCGNLPLNYSAPKKSVEKNIPSTDAPNAPEIPPNGPILKLRKHSNNLSKRFSSQQHQSSILAVQYHLISRLSCPISPLSIISLQRPEACPSLEQGIKAYEIIEKIEIEILERIDREKKNIDSLMIKNNEDEEEEEEKEKKRNLLSSLFEARQSITAECSARLGELITCLMRFSNLPQSSPIDRERLQVYWRNWMKRNPKHLLQRLILSTGGGEKEEGNGNSSSSVVATTTKRANGEKEEEETAETLESTRKM